jgi:hypothetical protein
VVWREDGGVSPINMDYNNDIQEKMEVGKIPGVSLAVLKKQTVTPTPLGVTTDRQYG